VGTGEGNEALATTMSTAWANFAHHGTPSAPGLAAWPAYSPANRKVMVFNTRPWLGDDPAGAERRALLKALG
jgi:para-nitrobenzyl esterase